jgi:transposase InsO family protein
MLLRQDEGGAGFALGIERVECLLQAFVGRFSRVDRAARPLRSVFAQRLRAMGIRDRPIAFRSPWQNAYVERLIGPIRRECLDHMIVFGEAHLRRILGAYAA